MRIYRDLRTYTELSAPNLFRGKVLGLGLGIDELLPDIFVAQAGLKNQADNESGNRASYRDPKNERHK
jgi:hypothetical protein